MRRIKVTVVGAGNVGATIAQLLFARGWADVALVDAAPGVAQGKAQDISQSAALHRTDARITGAQDYRATRGSDIVVITAGMKRQPGRPRDELVRMNGDIVASCSAEIKKTCPRAVVIIVSNPVDAMVYVAGMVTGFAPRRVVGMAGVLDSARLRSFIALELGCAAEDVSAAVLGGHSDEMVPLARRATVGGVPVTDLIPPDRLAAIVQRTRTAGAEILDLLKPMGAYYTPAAATVELIESIALDRKRVLPAGAYLDGEYGVSGLWLGVPCILGAGGVEKVIEVKLDREEKKAFAASVRQVRGLIENLKIQLPSISRQPP